MSTPPRLATAVWVNALVRRAFAAGAFAAVLRRGDAVAGAVTLVARGQVTRVLARVAHAVEPAWREVLRVEPADEVKVDEHVARQVRYDPDMWVVELTGGDLEQLVGERLLGD